MKSSSSFLALLLVLIGAALSVTSHADEEEQIVCPPTAVTPIHSPSTSTSVSPGSNDEAAAALRLAIYNLDFATVQRMLTDPNFAQLRDPQKGSSPLHMAVSPCNASMVQLVITHPGIDLNARDYNDETPLHAAANCDRDVLDLILNLPGADPNVLYTSKLNSPSGFTEDRTPLHEAAWYGNVAGVTALLEYDAHPNPKTSGGFTPLHLAAMTNKSEVTHILLKYGGDPNAHEDEEGRTPLHLAVPVNDSKEPLVLKVLLADYVTDSGAEDDKGWTSLHRAAFSNSKDAALLLLKHGADPNAEDDEGVTPLRRAAPYADTDMIELLLEYGADLDDSGGAAYRSALHHGNDDVADFLRAAIESN